MSRAPGWVWTKGTLTRRSSSGTYPDPAERDDALVPWIVPPRRTAICLGACRAQWMGLKLVGLTLVVGGRPPLGQGLHHEARKLSDGWIRCGHGAYCDG